MPSCHLPPRLMKSKKFSSKSVPPGRNSRLIYAFCASERLPIWAALYLFQIWGYGSFVKAAHPSLSWSLNSAPMVLGSHSFFTMASVKSSIRSKSPDYRALIFWCCLKVVTKRHTPWAPASGCSPIWSIATIP